MKTTKIGYILYVKHRGKEQAFIQGSREQIIDAQNTLAHRDKQNTRIGKITITEVRE